MTRVLGALLSLAVQAAVAGLLGVSGYGTYVYALAILKMAAMVSKAGWDSALVRFVAAHRERAEWGELRGILKQSVRWTLFLGLVGVAAIGSVLGLLGPKLDPELTRILLIGLPLIPLMGLTDLCQGALRGLRRVVQAFLPELVLRPAFLGLAALIWIGAAGESLSASKAMLCTVAGATIALAFGAVWLVRALPPDVRGVAPVSARRNWLARTFPFFTIQATVLMLHQTDLVMLGPLAGMEDAAIYAAAVRIAAGLSFASFAANAILAPVVSAFHTTGRTRELARAAVLSARSVSLVTVSLAVVVVVLARPLLGLFGEPFKVGQFALILLVAGQCVIALSGLVNSLLSMSGHARRSAQILGGAALANILLNALLIPRFGYLGAAVASLVTTVGWNVVMLWFVRRLLGLNPSPFARLD